MFNFADILKSKDPDAIENLKSVADKSDLNRLLTTPMSSEEVDALNTKPDVLEKMSRAGYGDYSPPKPLTPEPPTAPSELPKPATSNISPASETGSVAEDSGLLSKYKNVPDEILAKMGPIGQKIMQSKAMGMASELASSPAGKFAGQVGLPLVGSAMEAGNAMDAFKNKDAQGTLMHGAGALAGPAMLAESAAAGPLAAVSAGYGAGKMLSNAMGGEPAQPNPNDPNLSPTTPPIVPPGNGGPPILAGGGTGGMGPFADASKYKPSIKVEDATPEESTQDREVASATPQESSNDISKMLKNMFGVSDAKADEGFSNNTVAKLKEAQDAQSKAQNDARLTNAMNLIGSSIAGLGTKGAVLDNTMDKYYQERAKDDTITKNFTALTEKEKDDPDSKASKKMVDFSKQVLEKAGFENASKLVNGMSYNQIEKNFPQISKMADLKISSDARKTALGTKQAEKDKETQQKTYTNTTDRMTKYRGAKDVGNAAEALRNSDMAMEIIKMNPDLNNISNEQYNTLVSEISKIANGGVATEASIHDNKAKTIQSQAAQFWSKVKGSPTGAQLGDFIKQNRDYLTHLNEVNHNIVDNYHTKEALSGLDSMDNEHKQSLLLQYPNVAKKLGISEDQLNDSNFQVPKSQDLLRRVNKTTSTNSSKNKDVEDYANQYFAGDYNKAEAFLRKKGELK